MESVGAISEGTWNSFNGVCSEEADFMAKLLSNHSLPYEVPNGIVSSVWPSHDSDENISGVDERFMYSSEETNNSVYSFPQRRCYSGENSIYFLPSGHENLYPTSPHHFFATNNNLMTMDYGLIENKSNSSRVHILNNNVVEGDDLLSQDVSNDSIETNGNFLEDVIQGKNLQLGRQTKTPMPETLKEDKVGCLSEISKKRPQIPGDIPRSNRNTKLRKCMKTDDNEEENSNNDTVVFHRQSTSRCCSEDESNASHEQSGVTSSSNGMPDLKGKARASKGSAADSQSLYARKRREKINERLRILQNLIPNGTKVDISTMLEEAVQYVNFLQLQIKLLSSDDHWMYSPIAYNGMDIGLDLKISPPKSQTKSR